MLTKRELYNLGLSRSQAVRYHAAYKARQHIGETDEARLHDHSMSDAENRGDGRYHWQSASTIGIG